MEFDISMSTCILFTLEKEGISDSIKQFVCSNFNESSVIMSYSCCTAEHCASCFYTILFPMLVFVEP